MLDFNETPMNELSHSQEPGKTWIPGKLSAQEKACCPGHLPRGMNAEWPSPDNPYTCGNQKKNAYTAIADGIKAEHAKQVQAYPKLKASKDVDWMSKYLDARREQAEEGRRWAERFADLENIWSKKLEAMQRELEHEYSQHLENGYEEAYELVTYHQQKFETLQKEFYELKANEYDGVIEVSE